MHSLRLQNIVFIIIFLISLNLFSLRNFALFSIEQKILFALLYIYIIIQLLFPSNWKKISKYESYKFITLFLVLPLFTAVSSFITHEHSVSQSINATLLHWIFIIYFFLIINKIKPTFILKVLTICMLIKLGLTVIEQFTYPYVPFAFRINGFDAITGQWREVGQRSGIYRFLISDAYYLYMIVGFKAYCDLQKKYTLKDILLFVLCCVGIYLDQTRQIMFSFIASLMIISFSKSPHKIIYLVCLGIFGLIALQYAEVLFGDLIQITTNNANEDYIRLISYTYYATDYDNIISFLFGHGYGGGNDAWSTLVFKLERNLELYRVDIGIVGAFHLLGLIFISCFIVYFWSVNIKNWKYIDTYLQMMLISIIINIPMIFPLYNYTICAMEFVMGCLFYMIDKSIFEKKTMAFLIMKKKLR